jgi:hypothetical protein
MAEPDPAAATTLRGMPGTLAGPPSESGALATLDDEMPLVLMACTVKV